MAERRSALLKRVVGICGDDVSIVRAERGWPGIVRVQTSTGPKRFALHVAPVTTSGRERDAVERRFQNPGKDRPIRAPESTFPLLIGLWEEEGAPVLVGMDATSRVGKTTRQSFFVALDLLRQAQVAGWADDYSTSDELIVCFHPSLIAPYAEMRLTGAEIPTEQLHDLLDASGLNEEDTDETRRRARRATSQLVRDSTFRRRVIDAYEGLCALCGLDFDLLTGAHIYPAAAPRSPDEVFNGLALCGNHHSAFDKHLVWVEPDSRRVQLHPAILEEADRNKTCNRFVDVTRPALRDPRSRADRPRKEMFEKRYSYFGEEKYNWVA